MFSENEILLMIGVVGVLLLIITILTIFDIVDFVKNKKKKNITLEEENNDTLENVETALVKEEPIMLSEENISLAPAQDSIEMVEIKDEIMINDIEEEINSEPLIEEFNEPVLELKKEKSFDTLEKEVPVIKIEDYDEEPNLIKLDLEEELNKALDTIPNDTDAISKFEEEQERTAIISLDELMMKSDDLYNSNEISQYDDGNAPITIDEVINRFGTNEEKMVPEVMQDIVEEKEVYTHKESIPFISSVYGLDKSNNLEFENTATYEKLSREKNSDFMSRLREVNENK